MQVEYFIRFQGKCYDVGTKLKFYPYNRTWGNPMMGVIEKFIGTTCFIKGSDGNTYTLSTVTQDNGHRCVVGILEPIYYVEKREITHRHYPPTWKVESALIWYIIIMVVGVFFNARWLIWIVATIVFVAWLTGHSNNNKSKEN